MWLDALKVVLIGMGTVFVALVALAVALYVMSRFARKAIHDGSATSGSEGRMENSSTIGVEPGGGDALPSGALAPDMSDAAADDDAAVVAAIAAAWYLSNRRRAAARERWLSPWLMEGRRMLLFNQPAREPWRKTF